MRSPYAEILFEKYILKYQLPNKKILSESLAVHYRNSSILEQTSNLLSVEGIKTNRIEEFKPRYFKDYPEVCENADLILAMTEDHLDQLRRWKSKSYLLSRFVQGPEAEEIHDPFFSNDAEKAYFMVKENVQGLVILFAKANLLTNK